jgi:hypothetical protein
MPEEDDEDEGGDSDDSDRKSKMSFSYWGADKVTLQKPLVKHRPGPGGIGSRRNGPAVPSGYSRESSANAKFGNRLVSADSSLAAAARPASRRNVTHLVAAHLHQTRDTPSKLPSPDQPGMEVHAPPPPPPNR